jgi:transcriptional regulator with XRE-family HTH domain
VGTLRLRNPELYKDLVYLDLISRLAANVRRLRAVRGWTQEEAADRCGMATLVLQTAEGGRKNFTGTVVARLCKGFGVDVRDLFAPAAPLAQRKPGRPQKALPTAPEEVTQAEVAPDEPPDLVLQTEPGGEPSAAPSQRSNIELKADDPRTGFGAGATAPEHDGEGR